MITMRCFYYLVLFVACQSVLASDQATAIDMAKSEEPSVHISSNSQVSSLGNKSGRRSSIEDASLSTDKETDNDSLGDLEKRAKQQRLTPSSPVSKTGSSSSARVEYGDPSSNKKTKGRGSKAKAKGSKSGKSKVKGKGKNKGNKWKNVQADGTMQEWDEEMHNTLEGQGHGGMLPPTSCDDIHCRANGVCVQDSITGMNVRCQCPLGTEGTVCEKDVTVQYPRFMGSGYITFPQLHMAYREISVAIEFRPDTANGLLLFTSHYPDARLDFFSIALVDGYAELRFDCGSGSAQLTTSNKVLLGQWNNITVHRVDYHGWIELNGGPRAEGKSKGLFSRITFMQDLYLGGYKDVKLIADRTGMQWGYVGCVRYLEVNRKIYDMRKGAFIGDAIGGVDVSECSAHACYGVKCQNGGSCVVSSADTGVCLCPLGTGGDHCEIKIDIYVPRFRGTSYLQYIGLRQSVMSFTEIELVIKPVVSTGLIVYNGYTADTSGDFISLALVDGYLEYRFDLGTGPAIIRSRQAVALGAWHTVRFARTGRDGWLQVDNQVAVHGVAKGGFTQLTLNLDLFVGGHRNFDEVSRSVGITDSFQGCVQKIVINDKPLKLLEDALGGQNVDNCVEHPCVHQPCLNGGTCMPALDLYRCACPVGFENTNCEDISTSNTPVTPAITEESAPSLPVSVPAFSGDSFIMYDAVTNPDLLKRVGGNHDAITIRFRAASPDGLLLWSSEDQVISNVSDYLAVGLRFGRLVFSFNVGSGELVLTDTTSGRLDDGHWHTVQLIRQDRHGSVTVDGVRTAQGQAPGKLQQLNARSSLYIGGVNDVELRTAHRFRSGFVGCISNVTIGMDYAVDLLGEMTSSQHVKQCSGDGV